MRSLSSIGWRGCQRMHSGFAGQRSHADSLQAFPLRDHTSLVTQPTLRDALGSWGKKVPTGACHAALASAFGGASLMATRILADRALGLSYTSRKVGTIGFFVIWCSTGLV